MKGKLLRTIAVASLGLACCVSAGFGATLCVKKAAAASSAVARVGATEYTDYQAAWSAVSNGGTVTMLGDWTLNGLLTVGEGKQITVEMNGHMINRNLKQDERSGEIFLVEEGALLILNGNGVTDTVHYGTLGGDRWYYQGEGIGNVAINGSLLTGGHNANGGGAIHMQEDAEVRIDGVTIAGNVCEDWSVGGVIRLQDDNGVLTMNNTTIAYNVSEEGGAAIRLEGDDCFVKITNSKLHHNVVTEDHGDGGAIQIENGKVEIVNSQISFNRAGRNGGAVYVRNGDLSVDKDTVISYNTAPKEGGAIYADSKADAVELKGKFIGNTAERAGGAIYVNSDVSGSSGVKISDAELIGNNSEGFGGAVYVDSDNDIALSNRVVMHGNSPDNLYLNDDNNLAQTALTSGSIIGVNTSWQADEENAVQTARPQYFFSDKVGYDVKGTGDQLYFVASAKGAPNTYKAGNTEYDLLKRSFSYQARTGEELSPYAYYSDGFFAEDPRYYNEHLSSLASSMTLAAMQVRHDGEYQETIASKNIVNLFASIGLGNLSVHYPEPQYFGEDSETLSTIGYAIGKKTISIDGVQTTLVAVAVRGSYYGAEWASNVTLGDGLGEARGFSDAANQVQAGLETYLAANEVDMANARIFLTGYSRGGAAANLLAKRLTDTYGESKIFAYCFEAPQGGVFSELRDGHTYTNIHNIVNRADIVPTIGTRQMGFIRYGIDHIVPGSKVGTDEYKAQKNLMLAQLQAVNSGIVHNDYFHEATVEYVLSKIGVDLISENWFTDFDYAEDWVPFFIEKVQEYSFTDHQDGDNVYNNSSDKWYGYRHFWTDYEWYLYVDETDGNKMKNRCYAQEPADFAQGEYIVLSMEDAVRNLVYFYFGSSAEKKQSIMDALSLNTMINKINKNDIYYDIIGEWSDFSIDKRNTEFNKLWDTLELQTSLGKVLTAEELLTIKSSIYVAVDFLLDFVADDYNETDQDVLGTLVHNIGNILQTHYEEVTYSWVRSYDSFYSNLTFVCPHEYGEWQVVQEATEQEYGVQKKSCQRCGEETFEAIPVRTVADGGAASLLGAGSVVSIVCMAVALLACGGAVVAYLKVKKGKEK